MMDCRTVSHAGSLDHPWYSCTGGTTGFALQHLKDSLCIMPNCARECVQVTDAQLAEERTRHCVHDGKLRLPLRGEGVRFTGNYAL